MIMLTLTFALSMLQCEKATTAGKSEAVKNNTTEVKTNPQAANTAPTVVAAAAPTDEAPRISLADAKKDFDAGNVVFIDTRAEAAYKTEHIKGAINIAADALQTRYTELPKNKKIIAYCS